MYVVEIQNCLYVAFNLRFERKNGTDWLDYETTHVLKDATKFEDESAARYASAFINEKMHADGVIARVVDIQF